MLKLKDILNEDYTQNMRAKARKFIKDHPKLKSAVIDLLQLAFDEINDGASAENEYQLFMSNLKELI